VILLLAYCAPPGRPSRGRTRGARERQPSDRELQAYVDGALDEERAVEIEAVMRKNSTLRRTVRAYQSQNRGIRLLYDGALTEAVPERLKLKKSVT